MGCRVVSLHLGFRVSGFQGLGLGGLVRAWAVCALVLLGLRKVSPPFCRCLPESCKVLGAPSGFKAEGFPQSAACFVPDA